MIPILYLSHTGSSIGGGEKQLYYLVTNLNQNDYQPIVVCPDDGVFAYQLREANIPTLILNLPPWRRSISYLTRYNAAVKLTAIAKQNKIQLIHTSDSWFNPYILYVKNKLDIPAVSHVRNLLTSPQVLKYDFDGMDYIIAISDQSKSPLIEAGISKEKIDIILNCVDLSEFKPTTLTKNISDDFVVGMVGRIEPFKRQKEFVEIANHVVKNEENLQFHIIGEPLNTHEHRSYDSEVRKLVSQYGVDDVVDFRGLSHDMPSTMQELDLLVSLSAGSVIAEAMATGKPVIGTQIGSTTEMIIDGVTGYVVPMDSFELIADKIIQLVSDPVSCIQMGIDARIHAEKYFSIQKHVEDIQSIYENLV